MQLHAFISGRVQGVGYRVTTQWMARKYGLFGWVRNLSDGRVEIKAEGSNTNLKLFLEWLYKGPRSAKVEKIDYQFRDEEEGFSDFNVEDDQ